MAGAIARTVHIPTKQDREVARPLASSESSLVHRPAAWSSSRRDAPRFVRHKIRLTQSTGEARTRARSDREAGDKQAAAEGMRVAILNLQHARARWPDAESF